MWRDAYLQSRVLSADPVELICMLYDRSVVLVGEARSALVMGDIPTRSQSISKVLEIIGELEGSLNHEAGGEISKNLERLYKHIRTRLVTANLKQQEEPLREVEALLKTLAEGWNGIRPQAVGAPAAQPETAMAAGRFGGSETSAPGQGWNA